MSTRRCGRSASREAAAGTQPSKAELRDAARCRPDSRCSRRLRLRVVGRACGQPDDAPARGKPTPIKCNADPYPSTYTRLSRRADRDPRRHHLSTARAGGSTMASVFLPTARSTAVGGPDTPIPAGYARDRRDRQMGDARHHRHPLATSAIIRRPASRRIRDGNEATGPITPEVWAEHSVWPQDPGFQPRARQWRRDGAADPARLGQSVRRALGDAQECVCAHRAGDEVPRRALRPEDGVRRESQARLWRQGPDAVDPHGQCRGQPRDLAQGAGI